MLTKIAQIAELKTGPFGTQLHAHEYVKFGIPIINVKNIGHGQIIEQDIDYVPEETATRLNAHLLENGDIVFGRKGSVDRHAYIDEKHSRWMQGSDCIRLRCTDQEKVNPRYLSHFFNLNFIKKQLLAGAVGSTMDSMNTDILKDLSVFLPEKHIQDNIERILSDLEEKITDNNAICSELESMAKLLYDYWFVQFDFPDENGKPYKSSGGKMVWNEELKREIPEGWKVDRLESIINIERGISYSTADIQGNGIAMINLGCFAVGGGYKNGYIKSYCGKYSDNKNVTPDDLVLCLTQQTDIDPAKDVIGCTMLIPDIFTTKIVISQDLAKIACSENLKHFLFQYINTSYFHRYITGYASGSNILHLDINGILKHIIAIPEKNLLSRYSEISNLLWKKYCEILSENQQLASLRDFLLPMLMNGQVKIRES